MELKNLREFLVKNDRENVQPETVYLTGADEFIAWFLDTFHDYSSGNKFEDNYNFSFFPFKCVVSDESSEDKKYCPLKFMSDKYSSVTRKDLHCVCRILLVRLIITLINKKLYKPSISCDEVVSFELTTTFIHDNYNLVRSILSDIYFGLSVGAYDIDREIEVANALKDPNRL